jgi:hypothetical protein
MKRSDIQKQIEEIIVEILSEITTVTDKTEEGEADEIARTEKVAPQTVKDAIKKAKSTKKPVNIAESPTRS